MPFAIAPEDPRSSDVTSCEAVFARACERGDVAAGNFHHADHLRLALQYLRECGSAGEATERMAVPLRRFAEAAGHPEKYHHTLTVFWMRAVAALLDKDLPLEYYSRQRLFSDEARRTWIAPDLQPLDRRTYSSDASSPGPLDSPRDTSHRALPR
jgi:hypothetical protein